MKIINFRIVNNITSFPEKEEFENMVNEHTSKFISVLDKTFGKRNDISELFGDATVPITITTKDSDNPNKIAMIAKGNQEHFICIYKGNLEKLENNIRKLINKGEDYNFMYLMLTGLLHEVAHFYTRDEKEAIRLSVNYVRNLIP